MSMNEQFLIAMKAYQEIQDELQQDGCSSPVAEEISGQAALATAIPDGSLLLGMSASGQPVLLDLYDPLAGPLLVAGDGGSGKTAFLHSLGRASNLSDPGDIQFGVLTPFPEEWTALEALPNCLGVWPAYHPSAQHFLAQLASWADALARTRQAILLLCDGLDLMAGADFRAGEDLQWLLAYGPARMIWPVVTVNPRRSTHLQNWLDYFHTCVIGQTKRAHSLGLLVDDPGIDLADLQPGSQFILSQPQGWTRFWLPPLE